MPHHANDAVKENRVPPRRSPRSIQLIEAAKHLFAEVGYHNATISQVIAKTGVARGTFYLYFDSKRRIFEAILDDALHELTVLIKPIDVGPAAASPHQQLRDNLLRVFHYLLADKPLSQLLLNQGLTPDTESKQRIESFYGHVTQMIASSLTHGMQLGIVRSCRTDLVAPALFGAVRGFAEKLVVVSGSDKPESLVNEATVDELLTLALDGVKAR